jgi:hypothetical protein
MRKLLGGDHVQLLCNTTAHLQSQLDTEEEFVGFDVFGVTMRIDQLEQTYRSLLDGVLVTARPSVKDDLCGHVRLEIPAP